MSLTLDASRETDLLLALPRSGEGASFPLAGQSWSNAYLALKGGIDFCLALLLAIVLGPLILLCAVLVRLTSRGPAFYSQVRLGRGGRPYWIYKLRTMYHLC